MRSFAGSSARLEIADIYATLCKIYQGWVARSQGTMDDMDSHSYLFHNGCITESCGVEMRPLPLLVSGLGGRNQLEAREVA